MALSLLSAPLIFAISFLCILANICGARKFSLLILLSLILGGGGGGGELFI